MKWLLVPLSVSLLLARCAPNPYRQTNRSYKRQVRALARQIRRYPLKDSLDNGPYWVGTTNFNLRKPDFVIIHHTAQWSCDQTLKTFTTVRTQVSAHYVICRDGTIHHLLNDYLRAWQAGVSRWGNNSDINSCSIGIELDNNGFEPFPEPQLSSLLRLLAFLKKQYHIPAANFIGHGDIAPARKNDPNWRFPWKMLADQGYGSWYADTTGVQLPGQFDVVQALRLVGYDTRDSAAAVLAFKRHWLQDTTAGLTPDQAKVLYQLASRQP
ncbi:MAG TPA: N-acetylmuramoyl-L-alanine amidase [Chitinophagaceae bacterium]|nr:N-acetylmuramoyl-L-alanine amidase [Chitinophagaceae bacterium]